MKEVVLPGACTQLIVPPHQVGQQSLAHPPNVDLAGERFSALIRLQPAARDSDGRFTTLKTLEHGRHTRCWSSDI
jgi:hypothetical protein